MNTNSASSAAAPKVCQTLAAIVVAFALAFATAMAGNIEQADAKTQAAAPAKVKTLNAKSPKVGQVTVSIKKVKKATGYQYQVSKAKNFKGSGTKSVKTKKTSATFSKLSEGSRYYVRARAYSKLGKTVKWGKWSAVKNLIAKEASISISYQLNGGTLASGAKNIVKTTDGAYTLPQAERRGYSFNGWYTSQMGGTKAASVSASKYPSGSVSVYARWTVETDSITYNLDGGSLAPGSKTGITIEDGNYTVPPPTRSGYEFLGWYSDAAKTKPAETVSYSGTSISLFAAWKECSVNITYELNGGQLPTGAKTIVYTTDGTYTLPNPTREWYIFEGWFSSAADGNRITSVNSTDGDLTAYARWRIDPAVLVVSGVSVQSSVEQYSWNNLKSLSNAISAAPSDEIGLEIAKHHNLTDANGKLTGKETKSLTLTNGANVKAQIIGFRHDSKTDGSLSGITFGFENIIAAARMAYADNLYDGWEVSRMREWLSKEGLDLLPNELSSLIVPVLKYTNNHGALSGNHARNNGVVEITATTDKLWLFSLRELYGYIDPYPTGGTMKDLIEKTRNQEGEQYKLYADLGVEYFSTRERWLEVVPELQKIYVGSEELGPEDVKRFQARPGEYEFWFTRSHALGTDCFANINPQGRSQEGLTIYDSGGGRGVSDTAPSGVLPGFCF